jgi:hypothetical protein
LKEVAHKGKEIQRRLYWRMVGIDARKAKDIKASKNLKGKSHALVFI